MILSSTFLFDLAESAARSLALAGVVGAGLALLRTRNVLAQKAAWILVLAAAVVMPFLASWAAKIPGLPKAATIFIPQTKHAEPAQQEALAAWRAAAVPQGGATFADAAPAPRFAHRAATAPLDTAGTPHFPSPSVSTGQLSAAVAVPEATAAKGAALDLAGMGLLAYVAICLVLLIRLAFGLWAAQTLWNGAEPIDIGFPALAVRISHHVSSPVTVASGIVLPADAAEWDGEKLRIVLAHEASHVRQGDFYLQILCSVYSAVFWFSPLGWWLKRKLSDLSETISDGAAVSHASSHVSYAQVLLEFAALPRPVPIGVAMANHGRVTSRIEHLLNESRFRQAFAGGRARIACALALVALALCATTLVRVEAATPQAAPPAPASAPAVQSPATAPAPAAPASAASAVLPENAAAPQAPASPSTEPAVAPPAVPAAPGAPAAVAPLPPPAEEGGLGEGVGLGKGSWSVLTSQSETSEKGRSRRGSSFNSYGKGYAYSYHSDGESYALISGKDDVTFSGDWFEGRKAQIDKARSLAHGSFLWFTRNGKSYMLDDPAIVAQLMEMYKPMEDLGRQQEVLGKQQEELGRQQEELGRKQELASVPTPEMSKEIAAVEKAAAALKAAKGQTLTEDKLADMQERLAELQSRLGELQGNIGEKQGELGALQGELGGRQGVLGAQQGKLGAEQGRLAVEADKKVKAVIDESLKNGKARPVE